MVSNPYPQIDNDVVAPKRLAWLWIVAGFVGLFAAFSLTLERIHVASNPDATLSCDLNIFISCKSVMLTDQARLLGFPNPLIGMMGFVAPIAVGVAVLAGARFATWFWRTYLVGLTIGFIFVLWLWVQSTYVIGVLCPYCMVAWLAMIPLFIHTQLWMTAEDLIEAPVRWTNVIDALNSRAWLVTIGFELLMAALIVVRFWDFWPMLFR